MPQIAAIGQKIFNMVLDAGYWIILIMGGVSALKAIMKGNFEGAFKTAFETVVAYVGLRLIPILLNMIKAAF